MSNFDTAEETLISQYAAPQVVIPALIDSWAAATVTSMGAAFDDFLSDYWDIRTAVDGGLDNWGLILGVTRYVTLTNIGAYVGFYNSENDYQPMSQAPFFGGGSTGQAYALTDSAYRTLLLAKAAANISGGSIAALNTLAQAAFGSGAMVVADIGNMQMAYIFTQTPTAVQLAIANNSGVLPHPTGVQCPVLVPILNASLGAVTSVSATGYSSGFFGTLAPSADVNGNAVIVCYGTTVGPDFELAIQSAAALTQPYFKYLIIDGFILSTANMGTGAYSFSSGLNTWNWSGLPIPALSNGSQYNVLIA